ncbi:site-specific integrase [Methylobacterium sp. P31]
MPDEAPKPKRERGPRSPTKRITLDKGERGDPYLAWRPGRIGSDGIERGGVWNIIHKGRQHGTGCGVGADAKAEARERLKAFKADLAVATLKTAGPRKNRMAAEVPVAEVLARYLQAKTKVVRYEELQQRVRALLTWWGERSLEEVDSVSCAEYVASRVGTPWATHARAGLDRDGNPRKDDAGPVHRGHSKPTQQRVVGEGGPRRELEDLRAAINVAIEDGLTREIVKVTLPPKAEPRERWLTKEEAARLLNAAWRKREIQTVHRGSRGGEHVHGRRCAQHLARFILVALQTGSRSGPICEASFVPEVGRPWIDLKLVDGKPAATFYRKALGAATKKNKKAPTVPLPNKLAAMLWRWHHVLGQRYVIEWRGKPVKSTHRAFANLCYDLGFGDDVVRHSLRHTAVTWGMQEGVPIWELAGYVGMTVEMIEKNYGHHSSDHMEGARAGLGRSRKKRPSGSSS